MSNELIAIIGVNVAMFASLATVVIWKVNKHDAEIKIALDRIDLITIKLDKHASKIVQLYQTFVDLLKEKK